MVKTTITTSKAATATLSSVVACYKQHIQSNGKGVDGELNCVQKVYSLAKQGAISYNDFWNRIVKGAHQQRMRKTTQSIAANALQNANILSKNYNSFEDLFNDVNRIVGNINGVGQLTVYDISIRLGHLFSPRLRPTLVYLTERLIKVRKNCLVEHQNESSHLRYSRISLVTLNPFISKTFFAFASVYSPSFLSPIVLLIKSLHTV